MFAFVPNLGAVGSVYSRLLEGGLSPADISILTHHEFANNRPGVVPELAPCRGGLVGHGPLLERLDPSVAIFEALSQALLGSSKKMGTIKAALIMGEVLVAALARTPAQIEAARRTLDPTDGIAA